QAARAARGRRREPAGRVPRDGARHRPPPYLAPRTSWSRPARWTASGPSLRASEPAPSVRTARCDDLAGGAQHDRDVAEQAPVLDVVQVEAGALVDRQVVAAAH